MESNTNGKQVSGVAANRRSLVRVSLTALFAALIAAGTFISIPLPFTPVPIVLQNMFALMAGLTLGPAIGGSAVALYLIAGAIGLPVFAGATGGFVHFFGPTGGFLFGYLFSAILAGLIAGTPQSGKNTPVYRILLAGIAGILIVYVPGVLRLKAVLNVSWAGALATGFTPFIIGDTIKTVIAVIAAGSLRKSAAKALNG
ncbi:MAG: biotin transporter BioY [Treponema sp.]|jgi:biotin transport system substrate-specific component|nr:biotin transporter BioY [Treponema sp.]